MLDFVRRRRWTRTAVRNTGNEDADDARVDFRTKDEIFGTVKQEEGMMSSLLGAAKPKVKEPVVGEHIGDDDL
jgi:hypothetical protein